MQNILSNIYAKFGYVMSEEKVFEIKKKTIKKYKKNILKMSKEGNYSKPAQQIKTNI